MNISKALSTPVDATSPIITAVQAFSGTITQTGAEVASKSYSGFSLEIR